MDISSREKAQKELTEKLRKIGVIPVVKLKNADSAVPLARALADGGLPCAEVTFRTDAAVQSIKNIKKELPDILVGAGTVLTTEQVDQAVLAGASFIVSPGLNPRIVDYCISREIMIIPGCANPSDVEQGLERGLRLLKFFPAEAAGGVKMIKAMSAPYSDVTFMPTGGISPQNLSDYLSLDCVAACGGSWMVSEDLIDTGDFEKITALSKEAAELVSRLRRGRQ